jgi:hypothetical protein
MESHGSALIGDNVPPEHGKISEYGPQGVLRGIDRDQPSSAFNPAFAI